MLMPSTQKILDTIVVTTHLLQLIYLYLFQPKMRQLPDLNDLT